MAESPTSTPTGWARLWTTARPFARPMPRAGAWYPVVGEASEERIVIEVRGKRVAVQKRFLEIRPDRPKVFTVVVHTRDAAAALRETLGPEVQRIYAVCPACAQRVRVVEGQVMATCTKCGHHGDIAWEETG